MSLSIALPEIDLRHFLTLTDDTGMLQHAALATPDLHHGYCTDDNARALIAATLYYDLTQDESILVPMQRYLAFLAYAFRPETGRFRNFMGFDRQWLEQVGSEDSHARALWGLAVAVAYAPTPGVLELASRLCRQAFGALESFHYVRPWAFALVGLDGFLSRFPDDAEALRIRDLLTERLYRRFVEHGSPDWPWCEDCLTWGNAKLPHALLVSGAAMGRDEVLQKGLRSLEWLLEVQTGPEGQLSIIGNKGWYWRDGFRARFDQQPLEAHALVDACLAAERLTGEARWLREAERCFGWFLGHNDLRVPLADAETGGCRDGLTEDGPNANEGAESTLAWLLSLLQMHQRAREHPKPVPATVRPDLGYALVGAGDFGAFCVGQLEGLSGVRAVGVWNRTRSKAERLARQHLLRVYESLDALLADEQVGLVHVATIPALHREHVLAALRAGKHVLCEKPLATSLQDADEMIATARRRELRLGINFVMRYGPLWEPLRRLFEARPLGRALYGYLVNCAGDDKLHAGHWFWDHSQSGGIFVEHGVHFFDLLASWLGSGEVLHAYQFPRPGTELIDQVHCSVRYGQQMSVSFYHGFHQPARIDRQEIRFVFERGDVRLSGWIPDRIRIEGVVDRRGSETLRAILPDAQVTTLERYTQGRRRCRSRGVEYELDERVQIEQSFGPDSQAVYAQAFRSLLEDFIAAIADASHQPRVTAEDARAALAVALQADALARGHDAHQPG